MAGNFSDISPWINTPISSNYTSQSFRVGEFDKFAILVSVTGTASGTIRLQASIEDSVFVDIPDTKISISGTDNYLYSMAQFAYKFIRIVYAHGAGASVLVATINTVKNT